MSELGLLVVLIIIFLALFVVLVERKFLAYAQRRMGPAIMGRNGVLQIGLDLIKLLTKEVFFIPRPTSAAAPVFLSLLYATQLLFSQNFIWAPSLFLFQSTDSLILHHLILILLGNIFFAIIGLLSQSRYAILGTVRALIHLISLDIFITLIYSLLVLVAQSAQFHDMVLIQNTVWILVLYAPLSSGFLLLLLLESKRAPFDHAETESEVVGGYQVEYSGPMLLMFYLAEYLHLIISSVHCVIFFFGGWYILLIGGLLPLSFLLVHDVSWLYLLLGAVMI